MFDKYEFLNVFEKAFNTQQHSKLRGLSDKEVEYIKNKAFLLAELVDELKTRNYLRRIDNETRASLNEVNNICIKNYDEVKNLYLQYTNILDIGQKKTSNKIIFEDIRGNKLTFTAHQVVIVWGWTYATLCEIMKKYLVSFIDFDIMRGQKVYAVGGAINKFSKEKIKNIDYFSDIDPKVRNAFFHFDFEFKGKCIYCTNCPDKYQNNPWRNTNNSKESECLELADLLKLVLDADRSLYPLMVLSLYLLRPQRR